MKKIVPFTKELMFKTKIGEITSIAIDNTLKLDGELVSGEFIINGTYKMLEESSLEEKFNYNIPVDITIDSKYDTTNCNISIDDFTYEIINEETLKVNISVLLDDLDIKIDPIEKIEIDSREDLNLINDIEEIMPIDENINIDKKLEEKTKEEQEEVKEEEIKENNNLEKELFNNFDDSKEYSIYRVYTVKEDDTIDLILDKFNVTRDILKDYNSLDNLTVGSKIIIPSIDE